MGFDLRYSDLLTLCPQWDDLFVKQTLRFTSGRPSPRILDCGANVGLASLYFKRAYPSARITAFEADPAIHAFLTENLARNGASDVDAVNGAVWTETGEIDFRCEGADSGSIERFAGDLRGVTRRVPAWRLRDLIAKEPVDLLKLDIEGAERAVLEDCVGVLENVRAICLDLHEVDPGRRHTAAVLDLLSREGFVYSLDQLSPLPWRPPVAGPATPFPGCHLCWAVLVRAWRS